MQNQQRRKIGVGALRRRGIVAGASAVVAAVLAGDTSTPARASDGDSVSIGEVNVGSTKTVLTRFLTSTDDVILEVKGGGASNPLVVWGGNSGVPTTAIPAAIRAVSGGGHGLLAQSGKHAAVRGESTQDVGVSGFSYVAPGVQGDSKGMDGVHGICRTEVVGTNNNTFAGVKGDGGRQATGVWGIGAPGKPGVFGESPSGWGVDGVGGTGVRGRSTGGVGVLGMSGEGQLNNPDAPKTGVQGYSPAGTGVRGDTLTGIAVLGRAAKGGQAAQFEGAVVINGSLTLNGQPVASAANGATTMVAGERPNGQSESFGTTQLENGAVEVQLSPELIAFTVDGEYQVFLTPNGDCRGLYVEHKSAETFVVREVQGGKASITFDYRVVARLRDGPRYDPRLVTL